MSDALLKQLDKATRLFDHGVISSAEYDLIVADYRRKREELGMASMGGEKEWDLPISEEVIDSGPKGYRDSAKPSGVKAEPEYHIYLPLTQLDSAAGKKQRLFSFYSEQEVNEFIEQNKAGWDGRSVSMRPLLIYGRVFRLDTEISYTVHKSPLK